MAQKVILVRHGETLWSKTGKHTGRTDISLTEQGKQEALYLSPLLQKTPLSRIFVSPLKRAQETLELLALPLKAEIEPDLYEWNYGEFEGKTSKEIHAENPNWSIFTNGTTQGESVQDIEKRTARMLEKIQQEDGTILLVSSAHFLRALSAKWLGLSIEFGAQLVLSTASISVLGYEHNKPCLLLWNGQIPLI
jgi:broad specificity phosphatase PhoE